MNSEDDFAMDGREPLLGRFLRPMRRYPVLVTNLDGSTEYVYPVNASTDEFAFRRFDEQFMQWHLNRKFVDFQLADAESPSYPNAVSAALFNPDGHRIASYQLLRVTEQ